VFGNVAALTQTNVKRMLAYSSVAHAGYILAGLATGTPAGTSAALFYLLAYTVMNVGAFGVVGALEWDGKEGAAQTLDSLAGMGYRRPVLGVAMAVFMFALTGLPPLGGFIGKYLVFQAAVRADLTWLAVIGVLASVVSAVYYLRVLVVLWMRGADDAPEAGRAETVPAAFLAGRGRSTAYVVAACAVGLLALGVVPGGVISLANAAVADGAAALAALPRPVAP